ncbi:MAG TPA: chemotaxis response regulator protein-glutamate methylesterase [Candidatus Deferrimicrobium sp.]|nr:chemotaxis response regulator protein-glutamate methylesterase [Candidatus Deferrimicrobium sp.]
MHETNNRVLIVDDSPFMCQLLRVMLASEDFIVETARDGQEAIDKVRSFRPNVITLDIEMPVMTGLEALQVIMDEFPTPVIIVSSQTTRGAEISLRALEAGAFDIIAKPKGDSSIDNDTFKRDLITKIKIAKLVPAEKLRKSKGSVLPVLSIAKTVRSSPLPVVVIGTSTGGPTALQTVLTQIPKGFSSPILVVQHMPKGFTRMMAERLDGICELTVKEAQDGEKVHPGKVLIAPGGMQMFLEVSGTQIVARVVEEHANKTPYKPSVNVLFESAADVYGDRVIALVLTGMGSDGLEGCKKLKEKGATILAESEQSCIVYGMSKCIVDAKLADSIVSLPEIGETLIQTVYGRERGVGDEL